MTPHNARSLHSQKDDGNEDADVVHEGFLKTVPHRTRSALVALCRPTKPEIAAASPTLADTGGNGPKAQFRFVWGNRSLEFTVKRYRLLQAVWDSVRGQPYRERAEDEVMEQVWGDDDQDRALADLCYQIRSDFRAAGLPLTIRQRGGKIWLDELK